MEEMVAVDTVRVVLSVTGPIAAVTVVSPGLTALAKPPGAMVATAGLDELQVAELVKSS